MPWYDAGNWLQRHIGFAVHHGLCTKIFCSTCGAGPFRSGLLDELARAADGPKAVEIGPSQAAQLVRALRRVQPDQDHDDAWDAAARFILYVAWDALGRDMAIPDMERTLAGSWAGEVLARMKAHDRTRQAEIARHLDRCDPLKAKARRDEKKHQKQIKHAKRLAKKIARDQIWRDSNR